MKWIALFVVSVIVACQSLPPAQPTGLTAAEFWKEQKSRESAWGYLGGKVSLSYSSPKESVSGGGRFLLKVPNHIYVDIRDPFGRSAYVLAADTKTLTAHYPRNNTGYVDPTAGKKYFARFLSLKVTTKDLVEIWLGMIPDSLGGKSFQSWEWDASAGGYRGEGRKFIAIVDGKSAALKSVRLDLNGEIVNVTYSDTKPCCGDGALTTLARTVELESRGGATKLELGFESLTPGAPPLGDKAFAFSLPPGAQKILLND